MYKTFFINVRYISKIGGKKFEFWTVYLHCQIPVFDIEGFHVIFVTPFWIQWYLVPAYVMSAASGTNVAGFKRGLSKLREILLSQKQYSEEKDTPGKKLRKLADS